MSLISPRPNGSAFVALKMLTDAAMRSATGASPPLPGRATGTPEFAGNTAAPSLHGMRLTLSMAAAERAYGADSFLMKTARGLADEVQISQSTLPADKAAYKAAILQQLEKDMAGDPAFMAALKAGKVTVLTADEVPELNVQPMVSFTMFKDGSAVGSGGFTPPGFNHDQLAQWETRRGQVILGDAYAYYDKPA